MPKKRRGKEVIRLLELKNKIEFEFRCFYLDQMRTSKENIFAHSKEIELKKQIHEELLILIEMNQDEKVNGLLKVQSNLLESAYGFVTDVKQQNVEGQLAQALELWVSFLSGKPVRQAAGQA